MKVAILLTTCRRKNNNNDNKEYYYKISIASWLYKTKLPIFIVESSGIGFPEFENTRAKIYTCNLLPNTYSSSSQYEANSILMAMNSFKKDMEEYTHIIKITGRYFINIENVLPKLSNKDIFYQYLHNNKLQHSEIFGFRKDLYNIFEKISKNGLMEEYIYTLSIKYSYLRLPPFRNIIMSKRGGDNILLLYL